MKDITLNSIDKVKSFLDMKLGKLIQNGKVNPCRWCGSYPEFYYDENFIFLRCSNHKKCSNSAKGFACFSCLVRDNEKVNPAFWNLVDSWNERNKKRS